MAKKKKKRQVSKTSAPMAVRSARLGSSTEFTPDYTHVKADLRRIGILAAVFVLILIALRILLPFLPIG